MRELVGEIRDTSTILLWWFFYIWSNSTLIFRMLISIQKITQSYTLQFTLLKDKSIKFFTLNTFICIPGNHFCVEILNMLTKGEAKHFNELYHWIDLFPYDDIQKNNNQKPRVLKTHLPVSSIPKTFRYEYFSKDPLCKWGHNTLNLAHWQKMDFFQWNLKRFGWTWCPSTLGIQVATIRCHCRSCPPKYLNKVGECNSACDQSRGSFWHICGRRGNIFQCTKQQITAFSITNQL